jgi:hypothetical protein
MAMQAIRAWALRIALFCLCAMAPYEPYRTLKIHIDCICSWLRHCAAQLVAIFGAQEM